MSGKRRRRRATPRRRSYPPWRWLKTTTLKSPRDSEKTKSDKNKHSLENSDMGKGAGDLLPKAKEKVSNNLKTQEGKVKPSHSDRKSVASFPKGEEADSDDEFEKPTMSFESYLSYDQPRKKKKKIVKTSTTTPGEKGLKKMIQKALVKTWTQFTNYLR